MSTTPVPTKQVPVTMYACAICNRQTPHSERHVCQGLTDRQVRRVHAWQRLQAIAARRRLEPEPCPDCQTPMVPGQAHPCRIRNDPASSRIAEAQISGFVSLLRRVGFTVEKD